MKPVVKHLHGRVPCTAALMLLFVVSGCLGPRRGDYVPSREIAIAPDSAKADRIWDAIKTALRNGGFPLDRVDRPGNTITTLPVASQQCFEFWRHDVATNVDLWEATLNPVRRWAVVRLVPDERGTWQRIEVRVQKERLSAPDRQFNNTGAAYRVFGYGMPSTTGSTAITPADEHWIEMGHDKAMAAYLMDGIMEKYERAGTAGG